MTMNRRGWLASILAMLGLSWFKPWRIFDQDDFFDKAGEPIEPDPMSNATLRSIGSIDVYGWNDRNVTFTVDRNLLKPEHGDLLLDMMRHCPEKGKRRFERLCAVKGF